MAWQSMSHNFWFQNSWSKTIKIYIDSQLIIQIELQKKKENEKKKFANELHFSNIPVSRVSVLFASHWNDSFESIRLVYFLVFFCTLSFYIFIHLYIAYQHQYQTVIADFSNIHISKERERKKDRKKRRIFFLWFSGVVQMLMNSGCHTERVRTRWCVYEYECITRNAYGLWTTEKQTISKW